MPAPAHHEVGLDRLQHPRVAQHAEHRVGDAGAGFELLRVLGAQLDRRVGQVTHGGEQQLGDAADDASVHERHRRRMVQVDADAAVLLQDLDVEIRIELARGARIVRCAAAGQHGQRATAQKFVHAAR